MTMQKTRKILVMSMLLGMGLPQAAVAQEDSPEATAESGEIDEIVVLGARSLTLLRQEVIVAEDRFFDLYNELNDDDKYDIVCEMSGMPKLRPYRVLCNSPVPRRTSLLDPFALRARITKSSTKS